MKTLVITLSLLILLLACGRIPEDPGRQRKPLLSGPAPATQRSAPVADADAGLFERAPRAAPRTVPSRAM